MAVLPSPSDMATIGEDGDDIARRERIVRAADALLTEGGLDHLTIRAVLQRTGLARRALYESFPGKDDLVVAVFERVLRSAAAHFAAKIDDVADPLERIRRIVVGIVLGPLDANDPATFNRRSTALSREHLRLAEARPGDLDRALRPLLELMARQVALGMAGGALRRGDPELTARLIYNLVSTTTHTAMLTPARPHVHAAHDHFGSSDPGRGALAEAIWQFCRRAIAA